MQAATASTYILSYMQQAKMPKTAKEIATGIAELYSVGVNVRTVYRTLNNYCTLCSTCCIINVYKSYYRNQPVTKYLLNSTQNTTILTNNLDNCPPCPSCQ